MQYWQADGMGGYDLSFFPAFKFLDFYIQFYSIWKIIQHLPEATLVIPALPKCSSSVFRKRRLCHVKMESGHAAFFKIVISILPGLRPVSALLSDCPWLHHVANSNTHQRWHPPEWWATAAVSDDSSAFDNQCFSWKKEKVDSHMRFHTGEA